MSGWECVVGDSSVKNSPSPTYLCNKVWPHYKKNTLTCHQIWHLQWNNGKDRPKPRCGRDIQNREAGGMTSLSPPEADDRCHDISSSNGSGLPTRKTTVPAPKTNS
ncbi:hypothetical protein F441_19883 [Phytophthora nicotianae CJ01A1]|uniref:Uncharacterized protein n=2 Tax=Phytophthora nicotianae TaxID=4792 RepID=W2VXV2_PHYNI|nr:hypothetical protein F441_19883 [Phytophthora nicotianae CJ01A1]